MRERSTWNHHEIAKKAAERRAAEVAGDIYSMNQDHPQPAMDEYVIGGPSDFAEDVHEPNTWEVEYSGEQVKRDEIGMPAMRADTFNHPEKTASDHLRLKKAELCVAVAKLMLRGKKVASVDAIEDQAFGLMYMPDQELINTHRRLAAEQEEGEADDSGDDDTDEGQAKQAGEIPEAFKENIQKMKDKAKDKSDDDDDDDDDGGQDKQANQDADDDDEGDDDAGQQKQANDDEEEETQVQTQSQQKQAKKKTSDQGLKEPKNQGGDQNAKANDNWPTKSATIQQLAQMQDMMSQLQQMLQQAQQQVPTQQAPMQQVGDQQLPMQQAPVVAEGDELDQLLAQEDCGPMAEADIQMDPAPMDDNVVLASDDEVLRTLFAQDEQDGGEEEQVQQTQQAKQAKVRTASTRTVGTRPTAGVSKLGGSVSKTAATLETDRLASLWPTAPDVRDAFGLK